MAASRALTVQGRRPLHSEHRLSYGDAISTGASRRTRPRGGTPSRPSGAAARLDAARGRRRTELLLRREPRRALRAAAPSISRLAIRARAGPSRAGDATCSTRATRCAASTSASSPPISRQALRGARRPTPVRRDRGKAHALIETMSTTLPGGTANAYRRGDQPLPVDSGLDPPSRTSSTHGGVLRAHGHNQRDEHEIAGEHERVFAALSRDGPYLRVGRTCGVGVECSAASRARRKERVSPRELLAAARRSRRRNGRLLSWRSPISCSPCASTSPAGSLLRSAPVSSCGSSRGRGSRCNRSGALLHRDGGLWLVLVAGGQTGREGARPSCAGRAGGTLCRRRRRDRGSRERVDVRSDGTGAVPYVDALVAWGSVLATWMVARKVLENWLYWIVTGCSPLRCTGRRACTRPRSCSALDAFP